MGETGGAYGSGKNEVTNRFISAFWYLDWLGTFALHKYSSFCRQTLIGGNYGLLQNENGKYLLNPDYFPAQLFSHVMHGKVLKLKNNQDNTIHQYGAINSKGRSKKGRNLEIA